MPVKIRLQRKGRRKKPFYHIVVADGRAPRDGRFIEKIGSYNPMTTPATIDVDTDRALDWLIKGAQPTDTARAILRFKGVMYKKHLQRGVTKGALTQERADELYADFMKTRNERVGARVEKSRQAAIDRMAAISGTAPVIEEVVEEIAEATEEATEATTEAVEASAEATEEVVEAAAETAEEVTEAVEEVAEAATKEAVEEVAEAATEATEEVAEAATEATEEVAEAVEEVVEEVAETTEEVVEEAVEEAKEEVKEAAEDAEDK